jgi:hypothetical protein
MPQKPRPSVLAHLRFLEDATNLRPLTLSERFERIFKNNLWGGEESKSGVGSTLDATTKLRAGLLEMIEETKCKVLLDCPCGDFNWISEIAATVDRYIGVDVVSELIDKNNRRYATEKISFVTKDLTRDALPPADLIICRDCLVHLSFKNCRRAIENIKQSGATWLMATTFAALESNVDIEDGDWRALNMQAFPFFFPSPVRTIVEDCTEADGAYRDKSLGLWDLRTLALQHP